MEHRNRIRREQVRSYGANHGTLCAWIIAAALLLVAHNGLYGQTSTLTLTSGIAGPGETVLLDLNWTAPAGYVPPAGLQWTLLYPSSDVASISAVAGPGLAGSGKLLTCYSVTGLKCLIVGLKPTTISSGVVGQVAVTVAASTSSSSIPIWVSDVQTAFADGTGSQLPSTASTISIRAGPTPNPAGVNLTINSTHIGSFTQGEDAAYIITVSNVGSAPTSGTVTVSDSIPGGMVAKAINGTGWQCIQPSGSCTRSDLLAAGGIYPYIVLTVSVPPGASSLLTNQVSVSGGGAASAAGADPTIVISAAASPPAPVSANSAAGSGNATFTFTFNNKRGWQDLGVVNILINDALDGRRACFLAYSRPGNVLYLVADDGGVLLPGSVLTSSGLAGNSQCTVSWTSSSVRGDDQTLMLTLGLAFSPVFAGNKIIYMAAGDVAGHNSGWQPLGVWNVPGVPAPITTAVVETSPARGSGIIPTNFVFQFSDTNGLQDLGVENILVNNLLDGRHACYLAYAHPVNILYLINDSGNALLPGQSVSTSGKLGNSQCTVSWGSGAVSEAGNSLTLALSIAFSPAFGGNRVFYVAARDQNEANNTGWQPMATWTVQ
jgi:uncharacterized repeat protein (TIGR01451 family)